MENQRVKSWPKVVLTSAVVWFTYLALKLLLSFYFQSTHLAIFQTLFLFFGLMDLNFGIISLCFPFLPTPECLIIFMCIDFVMDPFLLVTKVAEISHNTLMIFFLIAMAMLVYCYQLQFEHETARGQRVQGTAQRLHERALAQAQRIHEKEIETIR